MSSLPKRRGMLAFALAVVPAVALGQTSTSSVATSTSTQAQGAPAESGLAGAKVHFKAAKEHYKAGRYLEAITEFKRAHELSPRAAITYNIARCYEKLSQWSAAIDAYKRFMKETDSVGDRSEALDKIEFLKTKIKPSEGVSLYTKRINAGKKAYSKGDYERAVEEFKAAYDLKASSGLLFNIAKCYERMGRFEEAIDSFQQYLTDAPNSPDKVFVEETIRRLRDSIRKRFQELSVSSDPPGAEIYLDGHSGFQGQTNFTFKVEPGPHTLSLELNGYEPIEKEFVMPDDKPLRLDFQLKKLTDTGEVMIEVNVEGARIFIDGAIIGLSPYSQAKVLKAGEHQMTVEAVGYPRYNKPFTVARDSKTTVKAVLQEYKPPVAEETLSKWGRNLLLLGFIGGGAGYFGPLVAQKFILRKDFYDGLGPRQVTFGAGVDPAAERFWRGAQTADGAALPEGTFNENYRENGTAKTFKAIQLYSAIGGGVLVAAGLTFYMYKWFRPEDKVHLITSDNGYAPPSPVRVTGLGVVPTPDGAAVGVSGSF